MAKESSVYCGFCQESKETRSTGPLLKKDSVVAHECCMLFSSGIHTKSIPEFDDLAGFSVEDVTEEQKRGSKLKCFQCKKYGATVGCDLTECERSYHYLCALKDKAEKLEDDEKGIYKIFCELHKDFRDDESGVDDSSGSPRSEDDSTNITEDGDDELMIKHKRKKSQPKRSLNKKSKKVTVSGTETVDGSDSSCEDSQMSVESDGDEVVMRTPRRKFNCPAFNEDSESKIQNRAEEPGTSASGFTVKPCSVNIRPCPVMKKDPPSKPLQKGNPASFWRKCREAGCVEKIFSDFILAMTAVSERINTDQADDEDYAFSLKVLQASGMLPTILSEKEHEFEEKLEKVKKEKDVLVNSKRAMHSVKEMLNIE
ncbi:PHD finger protein 11 [Amia ocellicauda]|uniref:PHD finger protein 11 n=1 Tax=Amia ocellicauda TaxID=2972642 RepID=UPI00346483BA